MAKRYSDKAKRYSDKAMLKMVSQILTFDLAGTQYTHYFSTEKDRMQKNSETEEKFASFAVVSWGVAKKANLLYTKTNNGVYKSFDETRENFISTDSVSINDNPLANIMDSKIVMTNYLSNRKVKLNLNKNILKTAHRDCYFYLEKLKLQRQNETIEGALYVCIPNYQQAPKDYMVGDSVSFDFFTKKIIFGEKPRKKPWKSLNKGYPFKAFVGIQLLLNYTNFKG